jgi:hypothetical protein
MVFYAKKYDIRLKGELMFKKLKAGFESLKAGLQGPITR